MVKLDTDKFVALLVMAFSLGLVAASVISVLVAFVREVIRTRRELRRLRREIVEVRMLEEMWAASPDEEET
jgi:hypothetical protein